MYYLFVRLYNGYCIFHRGNVAKS